jgi:hypothetical protein
LTARAALDGAFPKILSIRPLSGYKSSRITNYPRSARPQWPEAWRPTMQTAMRLTGIIGVILALAAIVLIWFYRTGPLCLWGC